MTSFSSASPLPLGSSTVISISELLASDVEWIKLSKDPHADTIRKVLRYIIDTADVHGDYMKNMNNAINTMRNKLALKFSKEDVDELMNVRNKNGGPTHDKLRKDFDDLRLQIVDLQAELERKPSIRYVDDNLRRKIDRTDSVIQTLTNITAPHNNKEMATIIAEINQMKAKYEVMSKSLSDMQAEVREKAKDYDVRNIQGQINELYAEISACPHRKEIDTLMSAKIDAHMSDYGGSSRNSVNNAHLVGQVSRLEALVNDHEGIINQLKEIENQENLDSYANTTSASRGVSLKGGRAGSTATLPIIHGSRFSTIMKKIADVEKITKDCQNDHKELSNRISVIGEIMTTKVSQSDFDTLSDILIEQQSRVDNVVASLEQVDLKAFADQLDNVLDFLNLPQDKSYSTKVDEIESSIGHLDNRVRDIARKQKEQQLLQQRMVSSPTSSVSPPRRVSMRRASSTVASSPRRASVASPRRASVASSTAAARRSSTTGRSQQMESPVAARRSSSTKVAAPSRRASAAAGVASPTFSDESPITARRSSTIKQVRKASIIAPRRSSLGAVAEEEEEDETLRDSFIGKVWGRSGKHSSSGSAAAVRQRSSIGKGGIERRTSLDSSGAPQQFVPFVDTRQSTGSSGRRRSSAEEIELADLDEVGDDTYGGYDLELSPSSVSSPLTSMGRRRVSQSSAPSRSSQSSRRLSSHAYKEQPVTRRSSTASPKVTHRVVARLPARRASAPVIARSSGYGQTEKHRKHSIVCGICYARGIKSKISAHHLHAAHGLSYK